MMPPVSTTRWGSLPQFIPPYFRDAICILKPLDPMGPLLRVKKVLFVFLLEVLNVMA
jgi:hypothetical protein